MGRVVRVSGGARVGRGSLWTPANVVTCARVALVPVWLAVAELTRVSGNAALSWLTFVLYAAIALTDKLDGWLARSRGEVTTFGKFLDPIADKLAVIVALLFLMELGLPSWVTFVIIARELLVDGLRMVLASGGTVVAASGLGKWKTATTMLAICGLLLAYALPAGGAATTLTVFSRVLMVVAVILTIWSGVDYFIKGWPALRDGR